MNDCLVCANKRFVYVTDNPKDPRFGKGFPCPQCMGGEAGVRQVRLSGTCRVPPRYRNAKIANFRDYAASLQSAIDDSRRRRIFVTVWGSFGTGKTHLLTAVVNDAVNRGLVGVYATWGEVLDHLRNVYANRVEDDADAFWQSLLDSDVLALDEVDKPSSTDWTADKLFQLVNSRYNDVTKLTLFATNRRFALGDAIIGDVPGPFESRLRERGNLIIALGGPDLRRA